VFGLYPVSKRLGVVINGLCFEIALDPVDRDRLITKMFFERQYREDSRLSINSGREKESLPRGILSTAFSDFSECPTNDEKIGYANERTIKLRPRSSSSTNPQHRAFFPLFRCGIIDCAEWPSDHGDFFPISTSKIAESSDERP